MNTKKDLEDADLKAAVERKRQLEREQKEKLGAPVVEESAEQIWAAGRSVQKSSLESTERALRTAKASEQVGTQTLKSLQEQSEQMSRIHNRMVDAQVSAVNANKAADVLNQYNKLIPIGVQGKLGRRAPTAVKIEGGELAHDGTQAQGRITASSKQQQTWEYEDEVEQQIGKNVSEISKTLDSLQNVATEMGREVSKQKETIGKTERLVDTTEDVLKEADKKTKKFLGS